MQEAIDYLKKRRARKFTAQEIRELKLFPWATSDRGIVKVIDRDALFGEGGILRAQISGEGRQRRYWIRGANIIKYIERYGPALTGTPLIKPKRHEKKAEAKGTKGSKARTEEAVIE